MFRKVLLSACGIAAVMFAIDTYFHTPTARVVASEMPVEKLPDTFEVKQLISLWYWTNSEIISQESNRNNPIRYSLYRDLQQDYQTKLEKLNVCVSGGGQKPATWRRCDTTASTDK